MPDTLRNQAGLLGSLSSREGVLSEHSGSSPGAPGTLEPLATVNSDTDLGLEE